jgi:hypothetical protein
LKGEISNQGLEGLTPAEMAGLYQASGENRWMVLLKKAIAKTNEPNEERDEVSP